MVQKSKTSENYIVIFNNGERHTYEYTTNVQFLIFKCLVNPTPEEINEEIENALNSLEYKKILENNKNKYSDKPYVEYLSAHTLLNKVFELGKRTGTWDSNISDGFD